MADQTIQLATTKRNGRAFRQRGVIRDVDNRTGFAAANVDQQAGGALHCFVLQRRVHTTLIAVGSIRMQTVATRTTGNRQRAKERAFQQHVLRFLIHAGMLAAKDTAHRQRFVVIRDHQRIGAQLRFCAVQQHQGFALFGHTHDNTAFNTIFVKGMHRLTQFKQYIVGDVNDSINGTNAAATQLLFHPQRRRRFNINAFHHATQVARAGIRRFNRDRQRVIDGGCNRCDLRLNQRDFVQDSDITRHANDP